MGQTKPFLKLTFTQGSSMKDTSTKKAVAKSISTKGASAQGLPGLLQDILNNLADLGPEFANDRQKAKALQERLLNNRFHLAVLGQFKRGKSTMLNALLGEELLPTSIVPLTAIPTFLLWGAEIRSRILYQNGHKSQEASFANTADLSNYLAQYITEAGNPKNCKGISHVEVYYPSSLLRKGVVLIDTPGIGSTFQHNTEVTLNFLPQCDAALFLISADPPITEVEVEFLKAVRSKVTKLFFILNKVDYLSVEERETLADFFRKVLNEQAGIKGDIPILCVSAREGLEARKRNNATLWTTSGMEEVWNYLVDFLARDKDKTLQSALAKKASDIIADVLLRLHLAVSSLKIPLSQLDERLNLFAEKIKDAEQQRVLVGDLLAGDKKRLIEFLEAQAEYLRQKARAYFTGVVQERINSMGKALDEDKIKEELAEAIPGFFEHELGEMAHTFDTRVAEVLRPHQQRADELIETIRKAAAELFDVPYQAPSSSEVFAMSRQPYWVTHKWDSTISPIPDGLVGRLLPPEMRRSKIIKKLMTQVELLVMNNVENLRWATLQNLNQAFWRFGSSLDERLQATILATQGAIQSARTKRLEHKQNMDPEINRLQAITADFEEIQAKLKSLF